MDNCALCGSTDFFTLDDGRTYCSICQTRTEDVEEVEDDFALGQRVRKTKTQKTQERVQNWTSFEAFNLILAKQTEIIAEMCHLGNDFKKLVFTIWATYLEKNEIAFEDNMPSDSLPKLQHFILNRDYKFIVKGEKELKRDQKTRVREIIEKTYRLGNKRIKINKNETHTEHLANQTIEHDSTLMGNQSHTIGNQPDEVMTLLDYGVSDVEIDGNDKQIIEFSSDSDDWSQEEVTVERPKKQYARKTQSPADREANSFLRKYAKNAFKRLSRKEKIDLFLNIYSKKDELAEEEDSDDDRNQSKLEQEILEETVKLNLITDEKEKKEQSEKLMKRKEEYHFSKFAKNIIRIGLFKRQNTQRRNELNRPRDVNRMTNSKTICIIYIAIRLLNYDIYLFDLIRWIKFNKIPHLSVCDLLPNEWLFIENDYLSFIRNQAPQLTKMNGLITPIVNYLDITIFPQPDLKRLIIRIASDLNLPDSFAKFVCNVFDTQMAKNEITKKIFNKNSSNDWFIVPEYETIAFSLIFTCLKNLFCVNDFHETLLSKKLKNSSKSYRQFIWSDWEEHTKYKLECFKMYIYPFIESKKNLEIENYDMYAKYYVNGIPKPKHELFEPFIRKTKKATLESTKEVPKIFEKFVDDDESEQHRSNEIEPSFYPFISYVDYVRTNFKTRNDDLLTKDFRDKCIEYLFEKDCAKISIDNPKLLQAKRRSEYELHNEKIKFLISLAVTYLSSHFLSFLRTTIFVEKCFFTNYYGEIVKEKDPELETLDESSNKGKKRRKTSLSDKFLDEFLIEATLAEENEQVKVLKI